MNRTLAGFLLLPFVGACEAPDRGALTTTFDTVAGVIHVRHAGEAAEWTLERVLAVGEMGVAAGEPSPEEFGRIRSVVADEEGRIFVADGLALEIRVFGPGGSFQRRMGRKGGGPGEIEGLHGATWLGEDTLVVVDFGNARLMRMTADGEHVDHWPWLRITGSTRFFHEGGRREMYAYAIRPRPSGQGSGGVWVRYTPEGPADTLEVPTEEPPAGSSVVCRGAGLGFFANPYADRLLAAPAPGAERVVARVFEYRLAFLDPAGDTVRVLTREIDPVPLPDDEWGELQASYREFRDTWGGTDCEGTISRPPHRPILRGLYFDHDGRMLVEHTTTAGSAFDLFDHDGRWLGTIPAPDRDPSVPPFLRDDRLYLSTRDSLGVQRVEVFRVRRSDDR